MFFKLASEPLLGIPIASIIITLVIYFLSKISVIINWKSEDPQESASYEIYLVGITQKYDHSSDQMIADSMSRYYDGQWWAEDEKGKETLPRIAEPEGWIHV